MCKFKSGIILKDRVYIPDKDNHTDMLKELNIADTKENAERLFVRAELIPKDEDVFSDPDEWRFSVDQDILPDWFVKDYEEKRMKEAVKAWASQHIHIGERSLRLDKGIHFIKDCQDIVLSGDVTVKWMGYNSTVERMRDNSTVEGMTDNSTVEYMTDNSTVEYMFDSSTVKWMGYNSTVIQGLKK